MSDAFTFSVKARDGRARTGTINTPRGAIRTPAFMPVGTGATVKAMFPEDVAATGADIILGNTYHLMLRPGAERIARLGGLHKFMHWDKPILTDSGGYQVMSLSKLRRITEEGVTFQSHLDGATIALTPERAIEVQCLLGSDIQMVLDECTPFPATRDEAKKSLDLSMRWAARSKTAFKALSAPGQALFGIVQGSVYAELRRQSLDGLVELGFDGYAVGGLSVGEGHDEMVKTVTHTTQLLPEDKPRYLMGAGTPADIIAAVRGGIDMFDCVLPTRNGRNAFAFTEKGPVRLRNNAHINDTGPIETGCDCYCCTNFSRGTLRHFFNSGEMLGPILVSLHNLTFYQRLMAGMRAALKAGQFDDWAKRIDY